MGNPPIPLHGHLRFVGPRYSIVEYLFNRASLNKNGFEESQGRKARSWQTCGPRPTCHQERGPQEGVNPLIEKKPRNYGIGQDIQPKRDLSRFIRWPKYIRLQRHKTVLMERLKVPPPVNQFRQT